LEYVIAGLIGYVLGSVPAALLVARRHGVDLHAVGDGNPGAWNALEHLGWARAWPAFAGDALKGTLAGAAGLALGDVWTAYVAVAAAMLGHAFPAFAGLRGGKAVMTFVGGAFALAPAAAAIALAACLLVTAATRSFARGARVGVFGYLLPLALLRPVEEVAATGGLMCLIGALFVLRTPKGPAARGPSGRGRGPAVSR
jgi:acyl phosphate:glycerol-3-phosphate acyltransferase